MADEQSPAVPENLKLKVLVRSPGGNPIAGAKVVVGEPNLGEKLSDAKGLAEFEVDNKVFTGTSSLLLVTIEVSKRHHSPVAAPDGPIDSGPAIIRGTLTKGRQGLATDDAIVDEKNQIHALLVDGGTLARRFEEIPTRRLTNEQMQSELLFHIATGNLVLSKSHEFEIEHDASLADDARCEVGKCKIKKPEADRFVNLDKALLSGVTLHMLSDPIRLGSPKPDDKPGDKLSRDTFSWAKTSVSRIDQRHAVGLARIGAKVKELGFSIMYTQGVSGDTERKDSHGWGRAIDIGGFSKTEAPTKTGQVVRPQDDFIVLLHWGNVPMFDPSTTSGDDKTQWKRFTGGRIDDNRDYSAAGAGKLRYRLDPPPFQESTLMGPHFVEASTVFKSVFDFVVREYADQDSKLPADDLRADPANPGSQILREPTAIDAPDSHFSLHPDMGAPNSPKKDKATGELQKDDKGRQILNKDGRGAHNNHYHIQLGPKFPTNPPTTRPK